MGKKNRQKNGQKKRRQSKTQATTGPPPDQLIYQSTVDSTWSTDIDAMHHTLEHQQADILVDDPRTLYQALNVYFDQAFRYINENKDPEAEKQTLKEFSLHTGRIVYEPTLTRNDPMFNASTYVDASEFLNYKDIEKFYGQTIPALFTLFFCISLRLFIAHYLHKEKLPPDSLLKDFIVLCIVDIIPPILLYKYFYFFLVKMGRSFLNNINRSQEGFSLKQVNKYRSLMIPQKKTVDSADKRIKGKVVARYSDEIIRRIAALMETQINKNQGIHKNSLLSVQQWKEAAGEETVSYFLRKLPRIIPQTMKLLIKKHDCAHNKKITFWVVLACYAAIALYSYSLFPKEKLRPPEKLLPYFESPALFLIFPIVAFLYFLLKKPKLTATHEEKSRTKKMFDKLLELAISTPLSKPRRERRFLAELLKYWKFQSYDFGEIPPAIGSIGGTLTRATLFVFKMNLSRKRLKENPRWNEYMTELSNDLLVFLDAIGISIIKCDEDFTITFNVGKTASRACVQDALTIFKHAREVSTLPSDRNHTQQERKRHKCLQSKGSEEKDATAAQELIAVEKAAAAQSSMPNTNGAPKAWPPAPLLHPPRRRRGGAAKKKSLPAVGKPAIGKPAVVKHVLPEISWKGEGERIFKFNPNQPPNKPQSVWYLGERGGKNIYATWVIPDQLVLQRKIRQMRLERRIVYLCPRPKMKVVVSYDALGTRKQELQLKDVAKARLSGKDGDSRVYASELRSLGGGARSFIGMGQFGKNKCAQAATAG